MILNLCEKMCFFLGKKAVSFCSIICGHFVTIAEVIMSNAICALVFGMLSAMGHTERASFLKRPSRPDPGAFVTRRHSHQDD